MYMALPTWRCQDGVHPQKVMPQVAIIARVCESRKAQIKATPKQWLPTKKVPVPHRRHTVRTGAQSDHNDDRG